MTDADAAAYLLERLLADQRFRSMFRHDPAAACREAGLAKLAEEMTPGAGKAMDTLDVRESRSSLAGVLMAAALEGVAGHEFWKDFGPDLGKAPDPAGRILSRIDLPAAPSTAAEGAEAATSPWSEALPHEVPASETPPVPAAAAGEFRAISPEQATAYSSAGPDALGPTPEGGPTASAAAAPPAAVDGPPGFSEADVGDNSSGGDETERLADPAGDTNDEPDQENDSISDDPSDEQEEVEGDDDDEGFDGDHDDNSASGDSGDSEDRGGSSDDVGDVQGQGQNGGGDDDGEGAPSDAVGVEGGDSGAPGPIVALARGEIGQAENPPGSNDSPRIREYRSAVPGGGVGPWCAYFASWVARKAGTPLGDHGQGFARVDDVWAWAQSSGRAIAAGSSGRPHPGDLIIWDEHMGVVESVRPDGTIQTVEGNSSDRVSERVYSGDGGAVGFVRMR